MLGQVAAVLEREPHFVGVTTARELTGSTAEDQYGLLDSPLEISRTGNNFEAVFGRPPFSSEEFIDFFNAAAPHDRRQGAYMISADWVYAAPSHAHTMLARAHAKIPAWPLFSQRAELYTDIANNAKKPPEEPTRFGEWVGTLPEPKSLKESLTGVREEERQKVRSSLDELADEIRVESCGFTIKDLDVTRYAINPLGLLLKQLNRAGYRNAPKVLKRLIEIHEDAVYKKQHPNEVINRFSRLPYLERIDTQRALTHMLAGTEGEEAESVREGFIDSSLASPNRSTLIRCIGRDGEVAFLRREDLVDENGYKIWVPRDYRDLEMPFHEEALGDYRQLRLAVDTFTLGDQPRPLRFKRSQKNFTKNTRKVWFVEVTPVLRWSSNEGERQVDLDVTSQLNIPSQGEANRRQIRDGLTGLVIAAYLSSDVDLPETLTLRVDGGSREQRMGAAQLPLLALMYRRKIMGGHLIQAAEAFAA